MRIMRNVTNVRFVGMSDMGLSVIVVTRNEEANIGQCLDSVKWADEIIVVDSHSTDRTLEIAHRYTDRIFVISRDKLDANINKNFGADKANHEWLLFLDADEIVPHETKAEIREILRENGAGCDGYLVRRKNMFLGKWLRHGGAWSYSNNASLMRKGKGDWPIGMHQHPVVRGRIGRLQNPTVHDWVKSIPQWIQKMDEYTSVEAVEMAEKGVKPSLWRIVVLPLVWFFRNFILKAGFRDGRHGFVAAALAAIYAFVKQAKLWEKSLEGG